MITSININKDVYQGGYIVTICNENGDYIDVDEEKTFEVKDSIDLIFNAFKEIKTKEQEELDKLLSIIDEKTTDEEKVKNKEIYPELYEGLRIEKSKFYRHIDELYKATQSFIYTNQDTPILAPDKWAKVGVKALSEYEENYKKAEYWSRDKSYDKGTYVIYYGLLFKATADILDNAEPEKDMRWRLISK